MLCKEVFPIKIIMVNDGRVMRISSCWAEITSPKSRLNVLSADMSLPFVF